MLALAQELNDHLRHVMMNNTTMYLSIELPLMGISQTEIGMKIIQGNPSFVYKIQSEENNG
jgi:hypothetical protein